jgi:LacI family transcriptional regulator
MNERSQPTPVSRSAARPPTLHDIAAHAGVSIRTVSRVVNERPGPSSNTRANVQRSIDALGYRPNLLARGLVTRQTFTFGLVATYLGDPFFSELTKGIQSAADRHGYVVLLTSSEGDAERQKRVIESLVDRGCDGLIAFPVRGSDRQLRAVADRGTPVVTIDYTIDHPHIGSVDSDTEHGARLAVDHFVRDGRRTLGMISSPSGRSVDEPRERGFRRAVGELAKATEDSRHHIVWADETVDGGAAGVAELLGRFPALDGVLTYNDVMAIGAMRELQARGRHVPDDVAVIGVDDITLSALVEPPLTTVRIDREQMGARAVDMLMKLRTDPVVVPPAETVGVTLVIRASA